MNIIARPYGSDMCYCRPDTTWERENKDLYSPECVNGWDWAPIVFVRISKAGKCVNPKFASRYYDGFNFGALLYICNEEAHFASCADHTSILPFPLYNPVVMENAENTFTAFKGETAIFEKDCAAIKELVEDTLCKASQLTSLRIGDFVAVELAPISRLTDRSESEASVKATFCENSIFDFKIIY